MQYIQNLKPSEFKLLRHAASQLAGRKAKRHTHDYGLTREEQNRSHQSPFKDIADSSKADLLGWLKEDGHESDELFTAVGDSAHLMHKTVKHHLDTGGSLSTHLNKIHGALKSFANTARVNVDVTADDFLHRVGLRHERRFQDGEVSQLHKDHAQLHQDVYKGTSERSGTNKFKYVQDESNDRYGTYLDSNNHAVIAFRGTKPSESLMNNDLVKNLQIAGGDVRGMSTYEDDVAHVKRMIQKYGAGKVSLSGYSQGSAIANELTQDSRIRSDLGQTVALAPGVSPLDDKHEQKARDHKISYIYHHNDPVANSLLEHSGANHHVLYSESDPLKSHLLLDRVAA